MNRGLHIVFITKRSGLAAGGAARSPFMGVASQGGAAALALGAASRNV